MLDSDASPLSNPHDKVYDRQRIRLLFHERCFVFKLFSHSLCPFHAMEKQIGKEYCGTHSKGQPYGNINPPPNDIGVSGTHHTKQIWCEAVNGIYYYIDGEGNVYKTEDIIMNLPNPKVIATYIKQGDEYKIPALFDK